MQPFVCRVGFATAMGQVPRVVPGYLELSFSSGEKQKRMEPSHKGRCFLRVVQVGAPAFCWSSHSSDDKCELITYGDYFPCYRIPLSVSGQTRGQNWGDTLLASAHLVGKYQTSFLLLCW